MQRVDIGAANLLLSNSIELYNYLSSAPSNLLFPPLHQNGDHRRVPNYMTREYLLKLLNKKISCPLQPDINNIHL
jgi:hypothetical protein